MRTVLRCTAAGAFAYVASYALIGLSTVPRVARYLTPDPATGVTVLEAYRSAGRPLWQAVGWFTLNAHGIPITVSIESGNAVFGGNLVHDGSLWLGVIPGWWGAVPMVACVLVGAAVVASRTPSPVPLSVGSYMAFRYLIAVLTSTVAFSGAVGPVDASVTLVEGYPADRWLLPVLLYPLVFGSLGAFLARSPFLAATVESLVSELSPR